MRKQLSDADVAGLEAQTATLGYELAQSRSEIQRLRGELAAQASPVSPASDEAVSVVRPVSGPVYRHFGNSSCTLSTDGAAISEGCQVLRQALAQVSGK